MAEAPEVRLADGEGLRVHLLAEQMGVGVRVHGVAAAFAFASLSEGDVLLGDGEHAARAAARVAEALLHGPEQIADLPVPVAESPGAVRIGHPERSHLVEYLVLPPLSVGEMTLRLYAALNYSQNRAHDLRRTVNGA